MQITLRIRDHLQPMWAIPLTATLAAVALLIGGCGGSSDPTTTGGSPSQNDSAGAGPSQNDVANAFKYSSCMRDHGVTNFPDPQTSSQDGHQSVIIHIGPIENSPQFNAARTACRGILPEPTKADLAAQAQQQRAHTEDLLSFARCLRSQGVTDFPDPDAQGGLTAQTVSAAGVNIHAPAFQAVARTCLSSAHGGITAADLRRAESSAP